MKRHRPEFVERPDGSYLLNAAASLLVIYETDLADLKPGPMRVAVGRFQERVRAALLAASAQAQQPDLNAVLAQVGNIDRLEALMKKGAPDTRELAALLTGEAAS